MDRLELRRKNFMDPATLPARDGDRRRLRLRRLPGRAGPAARAPRRCEAIKARARRAGKLRGDRLLDLHGDLRPRAVARHRPVGLRPADRPVGVGDGARAHHRRGHRLHRHLAARPGAGDDDGADRRRPARHRPAERRGHPRRHRDRPAGPRHLRLALDRGRRRVGRPRDGQDRRQGAPDRRPPARGGGRRHRARRREVRGQGLARQGHDASARSPARPTSPRTCPRAWSPGSRSSRSTTRRTSCSRSARTRASSTSTRTPATWTSSATSRSTTAARRSTRS